MQSNNREKLMVLRSVRQHEELQYIYNWIPRNKKTRKGQKIFLKKVIPAFDENNISRGITKPMQDKYNKNRTWTKSSRTANSQTRRQNFERKKDTTQTQKQRYD